MVKRSIIVVASALALTGASAVSAQVAPPPWSVPTTPIAKQDIQFEHRGAMLSGTLYHPAGARALATMVVLHGAGAPLRDEPLFEHLKQIVPRLGMAVFVYDRRGSGRSTSGGAAVGDFDLLAADAVAAKAALTRNPVVDPRRTGFWGLSQGGWLALLAASKAPDAAFAIAASAPMAAADVQMNFAVGNILRVRGYPQSVIDAAIRARTTVDDYARGKRTRAEAEAAEAAAKREPWYDLIWLRGNIDDPSWPQQISADPMRALTGSRVPTLILFGQADPWVPVATSLAALKASAARHPDSTTVVIDGADHAMMLGVDPRQQMDPKFAASVAPNAPAYFAILAQWLTSHGMVKAR